MSNKKQKTNWKISMLLLWITAIGIADPLSDLKNALSRAKSKQDSAAAGLSSAKDQLRTAERKLNEAQSNLSQTVSKLENEKSKLSSARSLADGVRNQVSAAATKVNNLKNRLVSEKSVLSSIQQEKANLQNKFNEASQALQSLRDQALNTKVLAYSVSSEGKLSYNFKTGTFFGQIDLGNGFTLDNKKIEGWLSGTLSIPRGNPIQFALGAASLGQIQHETEYKNHRKIYFQNTNATYKYYASERFVEWASAETAAHHVILGIATGGKSAQQSIREVQDQLLLEFNDVVAWLAESGQDAVENAAACALSSMLGESCAGRVPFQVGSMFEGVDCTYRSKSTWTSSIPAQFLPGLKLPSPSANLPSSHLGFGLNWSSGLGGVSTLRDRIQNFKPEATLRAEAERLFRLSSEKLLASATEKTQKFLGNFNYADVVGGISGQTSIDKMMAEIGLTPDDLLARFQEGNPIIDLKGTRISQYLEQKLAPLAQGNESKATITQLEFDLNSMSIQVTVNLLHRQSWGRLEDAISALNDWYREKGENIRVSVEDLFSSAAKNAISAAQDKANAAKSALSALAARLNAALANAQSTATEVTHADDALRTLQSKLDDLNSKVTGLKNSVADLQHKVDELTRKVGSLKDLKNDAVNTVERMKAQLNRIKDEVEDLERRIRNFVPPVPSLPSVPSVPSVPRPHVPRPHWPR